MNKTEEISISVYLDEFKFAFDTEDKISTIHTNDSLIEFLEEKLETNHKNLLFDFDPPLTPTDEKISCWIKRSKDRKILVTIKKSEQIESEKIDSIAIVIGFLQKMRNSQTKEIEKHVDAAIKKVEEKNNEFINEIKKENAELKVSINNLLGISYLHPLLDFVSKFRVKIVENLVAQDTIPRSISNWDSMYKHLKLNNNTRQLWEIIDDAAERLGLNYEDWQILKATSSQFNSEKYPTPRLTKDQALVKIEALAGTNFSNCSEPLKNIVNLFEENHWL